MLTAVLNIIAYKKIEPTGNEYRYNQTNKIILTKCNANAIFQEILITWIYYIHMDVTE